MKAIAIALAVFLLGSATVLAYTGTGQGGSWEDAMREHHSEVHGDSFEQHHQDVHGENWEEHVSACHDATEGGETENQGMGYGMM